MHPVLFRIAGHPVETAGLLYLLATIVAGRYAVRAFRRHGWDPHDVLPGLMLTVIAAYIGARLHWVILFAGRLPSHPLGELLRPGGLSFFGGMALGSLAVIGYFRWKRLPVGEATDALAPIAPVLYAIFRLGCLLNG
ncbi:MAG: prolipoprotein diacylglyceryl transferase, partial [Chloroflexota bacterium]|nr:prolipoprotein diacylglyceryl transferase [Chloroflexota bacterium]